MKNNFLKDKIAKLVQGLGAFLGFDEPSNVKIEIYSTHYKFSSRVEMDREESESESKQYNAEAEPATNQPMPEVAEWMRQQPAESDILPEPGAELEVFEPELSDQEVVEAIEEMSKPEVSVEVKVYAPAATKVNVKVDVEQASSAEETVIEVESSEPRSRYKEKGGGLDYWANATGEGIKLTGATKYHAVNMNRSLMLDSSDLDIGELSLLDDPDTRSYLEYLDCEDAVAYGFSPSEEEVATYWFLCHLCDEKGLDYNRRDRPETAREYELANRGLKRKLHISNRTLASRMASC